MDCLLTLSWEVLLWEKVPSQIQFLNKDCSVSCWQRQTGSDREIWVCKPQKPHSEQACAASGCYFLTRNLKSRKKRWQSFLFLPQVSLFFQKWVYSEAQCEECLLRVMKMGTHFRPWSSGCTCNVCRSSSAPVRRRGFAERATCLRAGWWRSSGPSVIFLHVSWATPTHDWVLRWSSYPKWTFVQTSFHKQGDGTPEEVRKVKVLVTQLCPTLRPHNQTPLSMEFSRPEYWSE